MKNNFSFLKNHTFCKGIISFPSYINVLYGYVYKYSLQLPENIRNSLSSFLFFCFFFYGKPNSKPLITSCFRVCCTSYNIHKPGTCMSEVFCKLMLLLRSALLSFSLLKKSCEMFFKDGFAGITFRGNNNKSFVSRGVFFSV